MSDLIARLAARAVDAPVATPTDHRRTHPHAIEDVGRDDGRDDGHGGVEGGVRDGAHTATSSTAGHGGGPDASTSRHRPGTEHAATTARAATASSSDHPGASSPPADPAPSPSRQPDRDHARSVGPDPDPSAPPDEQGTVTAARRTSSVDPGEATAGGDRSAPPTDSGEVAASAGPTAASRPAPPPVAPGQPDHHLAVGERRREAVRADATAAASEPEPVIRVHIGRLDVRPVISGRDRGRRPVAATDPGLSLAAYLRGQRDAP